MLNFQQITMPYLAAFVPPQWQVVHVDEVVSPVDLMRDVDLVGITFHTPSASHVYDWPPGSGSGGYRWSWVDHT